MGGLMADKRKPQVVVIGDRGFFCSSEQTSNVVDTVQP